MYGLISYKENEEVVLDLSSPFWADIKVLANELDFVASGYRLANNIQLGDKSSCIILVRRNTEAEIDESFTRLLPSTDTSSENILSLYGFREPINFKLVDSGQEVIIGLKSTDSQFEVSAHDSSWNVLHKGTYYVDNAVVLKGKDLSPLIAKLFKFMSLEYYDLLLHEQSHLVPIISAVELKSEYSSYLVEIAGRLGDLDKSLKNELTFWYSTLERFHISQEDPADIHNAVAERILNVITNSLKPLCRLLDLHYSKPKSDGLTPSIETSNLFSN